MPYSLKGRRVLVTAGSRGIGAATAKKLGAEGCDVAINYASNQEAAKKIAQDIVGCGSKAIILKGDAGNSADIQSLVDDTVKTFGGLDVVISNAGYTKMSEFGDLNGNTEDEWDKMWTMNTKAQMQLFRAAAPHLNANSEGGAFLMTSSVAGVKQQGSSMPYSITKAAGLHLMKCLAKTQGPKIRVNAVLPGLVLTDWGSQFPVEAQARVRDNSALKMLPDVEDVADAFVMLAKNASMTGMKVQVDGGLAVDSA